MEEIMNKLFVNLDSLYVLEQLDDKNFNFIILDVPYGNNINNNFSINEDYKILRNEIAKEKGIPLAEVSKKDIDYKRSEFLN